MANGSETCCLEDLTVANDIGLDWVSIHRISVELFPLHPLFLPCMFLKTHLQPDCLQPMCGDCSHLVVEEYTFPASPPRASLGKPWRSPECCGGGHPFLARGDRRRPAGQRCRATSRRGRSSTRRSCSPPRAANGPSPRSTLASPRPCLGLLLEYPHPSWPGWEALARPPMDHGGGSQTDLGYRSNALPKVKYFLLAPKMFFFCFLQKKKRKTPEILKWHLWLILGTKKFGPRFAAGQKSVTPTAPLFQVWGRPNIQPCPHPPADTFFQPASPCASFSEQFYSGRFVFGFYINPRTISKIFWGQITS